MTSDGQRHLTDDAPSRFLQICGRTTTVPLSITTSKSQCTNQPTFGTKRILLVKGYKKYGRTGNNLREFFHLFQYAKDNDYDIVIVKDSWLTKVITTMWFAIEDHEKWKNTFQEAFCVKIIEEVDELDGLDLDIIDSNDLFYFNTKEPTNLKAKDQIHLIQTLFRSYNKGNGVTISDLPVQDMCSVIHEALGQDSTASSAVYSVIHSRSLEKLGKNFLRKTSEVTGCDPEAALEMEPDYVKSILAPLGLLRHPIFLISDGQNSQVFQRLHNDADIGPQLREVPQRSSWLGGDMTLAIMSNAFIGNPASTLSAFIAQSRVALGLNNTYLFRAKDDTGEWRDVCDENCLFGPRMALEVH